MQRSPENKNLSRFAVATAAATLVLICFGGLVTSHGAGLAVPDWPNTYGYNLFFFPIDSWVGGIFYEHTHRLIGSFVGLLTTLLALGLMGRSGRPWLRWGGISSTQHPNFHLIKSRESFFEKLTEAVNVFRSVVADMDAKTPLPHRKEAAK